MRNVGVISVFFRCILFSFLWKMQTFHSDKRYIFWENLVVFNIYFLVYVMKNTGFLLRLYMSKCYISGPLISPINHRV